MRCPVPENSKQKRRDESRNSPQGAAASIFLLAAISLAGGVHAAGKDPTVPPAAWLAVQPVAAGTQAAVSAVDSSSVRLVLVGKTRKLALIDGQVIKPGDTHNGARVVAIGRGQVLMQEKEKSLKLAPGVQKNKASSRSGAKQPKRIVVGGTPAANEKQTGNRSSQ